MFDFHKRGILVSMFVDPNEKQKNASKYTGADFVEIHTGTYADSNTSKKKQKEFQKIKKAVLLAKNIGLHINAGHGLNYINVVPLVNLRIVEEFSIGDSIISRAIFYGLFDSVKEMLRLVK